MKKLVFIAVVGIALFSFSGAKKGETVSPSSEVQAKDSLIREGISNYVTGYLREQHHRHSNISIKN